MGNVLVKEETLTQIADAIREKSGTTDKYRPREMPNAILEISTWSGEGADPNKPIRFYGPYGDLVYSYTVSEFSELTELPSLPEIKGLIGQEWNWSLEKILEIGGEVEIGSNYITDDGSTRIYIELIEGALNPKIGFKQYIANSIQIDWGDGSEFDTSDAYGGDVVSIEHQYAESGNYVIRLIPNDEATFILFGYSLSSAILHKTLESTSANLVYANAIKKIELGKGITTLGSNAFTCGAITSVTIPAEITNFTQAFTKCKGIEYIVFPKTVSDVDASAMEGCSSLKKVVFAESYLFLTQYTFYNCTQLQEIVLPPNILIGNGYVFSGCSAVKRFVISRGSAGDSEFQNCSSAREIIFYANFYEVGSNAFRSCSQLEHIELPETVIKIGSYAFGGCTSLRYLKIPDGVTEISSNMCYQNHSLQEIMIPAGVTAIGNSAFGTCKGMENYYLLPITPPTLTSTNALTVSDGVKIHVPKGCLEAYQTAEYWSTWADYMVEMEE